MRNPLQKVPSSCTAQAQTSSTCITLLPSFLVCHVYSVALRTLPISHHRLFRRTALSAFYVRPDIVPSLMHMLLAKPPSGSMHTQL